MATGRLIIEEKLRLCGVVRARALEFIMTWGGAVKVSLRSGKNTDSEAEQYWKFQDHRDGKLMGLENGGCLHEWLMDQRVSSSSWNNRKGLTERTVSINQSTILNSKGRARKHCMRAERTASWWPDICIEYFKLGSLGGQDLSRGSGIFSFKWVRRYTFWRQKIKKQTFIVFDI